MHNNLGTGMTAKCIINPSLKCGNFKRSHKYISKIVEINNDIINSIINNEIEISKLIKKSGKSLKWIDNNFALIERVCPNSKLSKNIIKKCNMSSKTKNKMLIMRNVGCNAIYKGSKIETKYGKARILKTKKKIVSVKYNNNTISNITRNNIIKYCGDLSNSIVLNRIKILGSIFIKKILVKLLNAIKFLHSINITHNDIKNGNIVMDSNYNVRIIDFGSSIHLSTLKSDKELIRKMSMSTPYFVPPEICILQYSMNNYSKKITINKTIQVSGIKKTPKTFKFIEELYKNRKKIKHDLFYSKNPSIFKYDVYSLGRFLDLLYKVTQLKMPKKIKILINKMLEPDYKKRFSINQCLRYIK